MKFFITKLYFLFFLIIVILYISCQAANGNYGYNDKYNYSIGDIGPANGYIFYINPNADYDRWKYLEAAPNDLPVVYQWYNGSYIATGAISTEIGTGEANTLIIITKQSVGSYAAAACSNFEINGYENWFLPSIDELVEMYTILHDNGIGNFSNGSYWSSSESSIFLEDDAWCNDFDINHHYTPDKNGTRNIRPVRAF